VQATGLGWRTIQPQIIDYLSPFLDGMNGSAASKIEKACKVIDAAVAEVGKPSLRYIFHAEMYWKRLSALSDPDAKPLSRAARRRAEAPRAGGAPSTASESPRAFTGPPGVRTARLRDERRAAPLEAFAPQTDSPWSPRVASTAPSPVEPPMTPEERAELEELYRLDNEARARRGLPPRYPTAQHAA